MNRQQFNTEKLDEGCRELGIDLDSEQKRKMIVHLETLAKWNKTLNLTAITDMEQMIIQHSLDSLAIFPFIKPGRLLDIGTGGGFPGLPLAILNPELEVTLLDTRGRRVEFLRNVCLKLGLKNVSLVNSRVEDYRPSQKFDTLTTRAFSSMSDMLKWTKTLQYPGCRLAALKGKMPVDEIDSLLPEVQRSVRVEKISIPFLAAQRHLILIDF
ncbi:MAG: 16S rRNA (guanine(527)-N(7))-methyltransferase RsmG [Gammaproteobacteria bacterium]|nr:16S rRNA (guanine(527)-N(7))-methyltransferase RsmG [Gammaproteobacteria bacterium]